MLDGRPFRGGRQDRQRETSMNAAQLSELVEELNYILAKIHKYLRTNQYVYLRAFDSWQKGYNDIAAQLNADKTLSVPISRLSPVDYSPTGKSIKTGSVEKFVKTINHQVIRIEDRIAELNKAAEERSAPLAKFFHRAADGSPIEPPAADKRVFVAIPAGEEHLQLFWQGIQPALEAQGFTFYRADRALLDDAALDELGRELHSCRLAIFNLDGQAPNVMFVLGLAYAIDKPRVILQPQGEIALGEAHGGHCLRYTTAADIKIDLRHLLSPAGVLLEEKHGYDHQTR